MISLSPSVKKALRFFAGNTEYFTYLLWTTFNLSQEKTISKKSCITLLTQLSKMADRLSLPPTAHQRKLKDLKIVCVLASLEDSLLTCRNQILSFEALFFLLRHRSETLILISKQ